MIDQDYICKAVELTDGWTLYDKERLVVTIIQEDKGTDWVMNLRHQPGLDALAAQLVRQVDELSGYWVTTRPDRTRVMAELISGIFGEAEGPDRTMNTIKVIVDSKILEVA